MADDVIKDLHEQWLWLTREVADAAVAQNYFEILIAAYSEAHRVYHKPDHLHHLLKLLCAAKVVDEAVFWASFYHDYVYEPGKNTNEYKSAKIAAEQLKLLGVSQHMIERVGYLILATHDHKCSGDDYEARLFLDADMAILGEERNTYINYVNAVKQEFSCIPQFLYHRGRKSFLKKLLKQEKIFSSNWFFERFEKPARENISWELGTNL